jgi:hypothetical protein
MKKCSSDFEVGRWALDQRKSIARLGRKRVDLRAVPAKKCSERLESIGKLLFKESSNKTLGKRRLISELCL